MTLNLKASELFELNATAPGFIVVNQGGTSSGKTYSILQVLLTKCFEGKKHISVVAATLPQLKRGALKDWINILTLAGLYSDRMHNKTDNIFHVGQSVLEFVSLDDPAKARGSRRDILFVNEANVDIAKETFDQLVLRTAEKVFVDYNPADEFHWLYEDVCTRPDCTYIESNYTFNPFLPETIIQSIERLKETDENDWQVYGLGKRGKLREAVYRPFAMLPTYPDKFDEKIYGLDFGFNNPTCLLEIGIKDKCYYVTEKLYHSEITTPQIIELMQGFRISKNDFIYADAAEPDRIREIFIKGYMIKPADKSVTAGIDAVKGLHARIFTRPENTNFNREMVKYKYKKDINGIIREEPVKEFDHAMDALRYAIFTHNKHTGEVIY